MKFIETMKTLAKRQDIFGLYSLLEELAADSETFASDISGVEICVTGTEKLTETPGLYFYYSGGEVAFILSDASRGGTELADEEGFNGEPPLWFSERSHRVSPFAQLKALMSGFLETLHTIDEDITIENSLCVLLTHTNIINYDDYVNIFDDLGGAVFHNVKNMYAMMPLTNNNSKGRDMLDLFLNSCSVHLKLHDIFGSFTYYAKTSANKPECSTLSTNVGKPIDINNYFDEKEFDDFIASEDADFKNTEDIVNVQTGEKLTIRKDTDLPPVNILEPMVNPQDFLDGMVGLDQLKTNISEIISYARYSQKVKDLFPGYYQQPVNLHTIIIGNPGTGKTTMCRIYGGLLHQAGVLSRGHTVVASRGSFIGQQFGTEELRMRQCLKLAQGGCLFIDEAALLFTNAHPHDPGKNVIQLMLQLLAEENNRDIAVVLALYANDRSLERLYDLNGGIKSRFVNVLSFPDYSLSELLAIARRKAKAQGLSFTAKAWQRFCSVIKEDYDNKDKNYGNAREVVNQLQRCVIKHAVRCEKHNITGDELLRITVHDIPDTKQIVLNRRIGFN